MRRLILSGLFTLAILLSIFKPASPQTQNGKEEQAVRKVLNAWTAALGKNDYAAVAKIVANDYLISTATGEVLDKERDLAPIKSGEVQFDTARTESVQVRVFEKAAIVTGIGVFKGTYQGRPFDVRERFTDVYLKRKNGWQPVAAHSTNIKPSAAKP